MAKGGAAMENPDRKPEVNLFRPKSHAMKGEVLAMLVVLAGWGVAVFGFQLLLMLSTGPSGTSWLERFTFFNLPFHFWFTAQMLPLWFIIICVLFNLFMDRLTERRDKGERYHD
jgi:putative solute:sodium symporter small subunit